MFFATQHCTRSPLFSVQSTKRAGGTPKLNLVSLMDIFTILVFFLMLNSGDVEVLQPDEQVVLPKSYAKMRPDAAPVIKISGSTILYKDVAIASLDSVGQKDELIRPLYEALMRAKANISEDVKKSSELFEGGGKSSISVMGDANVPYTILKKVLYTCAQAGFRNVALAVEYAPSMVSASSEASS